MCAIWVAADLDLCNWRPLRHPPCWHGCCFWIEKEGKIVGTILIVLLILVLLGALPTWPYSASWGYGPSGGVGLILVILVILILAGRL
jgi:Protein of unknown function (DUF3309)